MTPDTRGRLRVAGALLLVAEGVGLVAAGGWLGIRSLGGDVQNRAGGGTGGLVAVLGGAALLALAAAVLRAADWARSPVLVLQILCLPVGWGLLQAHRPEFGIPVIGIPLAALVVLGAAGAFSPGDGESD